MNRHTKSKSNPTTVSRITDLAQAFMQGIIEPSRAAFFAMLAGMVFMVVTVLWFFSYDTLSGPSGAYLARSASDSDGMATYRALQISRGNDARPLLIVLGTSIISNAFASEELVEASLRKETGLDWQVAMLTTALQSPVDQIALIETVLRSTLLSGRRVVLTIGVDTVHASWTSSQMLEVDRNPRLGLRSDWADAEIVRLGGVSRPRSQFYIFENWQFFIVNGTEALMRLFARKPAARRFDLYAPEISLPDNERNRTLIASQIREAFYRDDEGVLGSLRELVKNLETYPLTQVALIHELPSPALIKQENLGEIVALERARYEAFAEEIGAEFWPILSEISGGDAAFYDDLHIGDADTQSRLRNALATNVGNLVAEWK